MSCVQTESLTGVAAVTNRGEAQQSLVLALMGICYHCRHFEMIKEKKRAVNQKYP